MRADLRSRTSSESRQDLLRFLPFWAGLAFAAYVLVQTANPWVRVDDVEGFWKAQGFTLPKGEATHVLRPLGHVAWLPSGVDAPFSGGNRLWFGMNAWRVLVTLAGPWMLLCALAVGLQRRRGYVALGWTSVLAAVVTGLFCLMNQPASGRIMGVPLPPDTTVFGPFLARNHGAVYLYLHAALALALGFWHLRRSGEHASLGGPHLVAGFAVLALAALSVLVNSMGAVIVLLLLLLAVLPVAWKVGMGSAGFALRDSAFYSAVAALLAALALLSVTNFGNLERKISGKIAAFSRTGTDDRAPYRRATWAMATEGGLGGRIWYGWGAGSYRWVSPPYQAAQPELLRADGSVRYRAHYAHNDWLQLLAEVGLVGCVPVLAFCVWLLRRLRQALMPGRPEAVVLGGTLLLFGLHAWFDLLVWFTPVLYPLTLLTAALLAFLSRSSSQES
ncbi:MAG: O-antigen ligase family protein [Opitutales bacterium]